MAIEDGLYIGGTLYKPGTVSSLFLSIDKRPFLIIGILIFIYIVWRSRR